MYKLTKWLKVAKAVTFPLLLLIPSIAFTQVTLDSAYSAARRNYPLIKQRELLKQTANLTIENLRKGYLPQVSVTASGGYYSAVTQVDVPIPGIKIEPPSKDQYRIYADVNQLIYDGGQIKEQQTLQALTVAVEDQKLEVELYKLQDRINQLYLGILYLDAQTKQVNLVEQDLQSGINRVQVQVENGVSFKSNLYVLQAELLKAGQRKTELKAARTGLLQTLGLFMNVQLDENTQLTTPAAAVTLRSDITRPELKLFSDQSVLLHHQQRLIQSRILPKASLYFQGGYGKPGLNMLRNEFAPWYIAGVRLNWSPSSLYTTKRERQLIEVNKRIVDVQKETFVFNTNTQLTQQRSEIEKLQQLLQSDNDIIALRIKIKDAAKAQLENGVITANDYLREVTAEDQARQTLIAHNIQLLQAQINYRNITGF